MAATILVVEDDASLRLLCRVNAELEGFRALEAASLEEARELLAREPVDVILLDIHVQGEDGRELLRELRAGGGRTPRVALVTGSGTLDADDQRLADAVLAKPFEIAELVAVVRRLAGPSV